MPRVLHSAVLGLINVAAILGGFAAYHLLKPADQIMVQVPVAAALSVAAFSGWLGVSCRVAPQKLQVRGSRDALWIYALALVWAAVVFVPVHFITQGYVTAFSNLVALWGFQLIVNAVAVPLGMMAARRRVGVT